jgi:hypothetical protein
MARKTKDLKPLLATKHDFVESLDNVVQQTLNMISVGHQMIKLKLINNDEIAKMFAERLEALKNAVFEG